MTLQDFPDMLGAIYVVVAKYPLVGIHVRVSRNHLELWLWSEITYRFIAWDVSELNRMTPEDRCEAVDRVCQKLVRKQ